MVASFDSSTFNVDIKIVQCSACNFVYNDIDNTNIEQFYQDESLYSGESGFGIGGSTPADLDRYKKYMDILDSISISKDTAIVDVGCAKGGFLAFLHQYGFSNLNGIEIDPKCVEYARTHYGLKVSESTVNSLPFDDSSMELLIYNHVLEHLHDPLRALAEAGRVLKDDGIVFVEVPNAGRYVDGRIFDYYWFCMREHINHFDSTHLSILMESAGFEKISDVQFLVPYNAWLSYPSLCALFRKAKSRVNIAATVQPEPGLSIRRYIDTENDFIKARRNQLAKLAESGRPIYVWGVSIEFFSLYSLAALRACNIRHLVDKNPAKQGKKVDGIKVVPPECFETAGSDAVVIIASVFNKDVMTDHLQRINFRGDVITLD